MTYKAERVHHPPWPSTQLAGIVPSSWLYSNELFQEQYNWWVWPDSYNRGQETRNSEYAHWSHRIHIEPRLFGESAIEHVMAKSQLFVVIWTVSRASQTWQWTRELIVTQIPACHRKRGRIRIWISLNTIEVNENLPKGATSHEHGERKDRNFETSTKFDACGFVCVQELNVLP